MGTNFFNKINPRGLVLFVKDINDFYGIKFTSLITTIYFGSIGCVYSLVSYVQLPYWQEAGHNESVQSVMSAIAISPWTAKGIIGIVTDSFPIFGYYKTSYLLIYSVIGLTCMLVLAFMPISVSAEYPALAGALFFGLNLYTAACDLLCESKYIELMHKYPNKRANILSYAWFCTLIGQFFPAGLTGFVSDRLNTQTLFLIFAILIVFPIYPLCIGAMIEDKAEPSKNNRINLEKMRDDWELFFLTGLQSICAIFTIVFTQMFNEMVQLIFFIIAVAIISFFGFMYLHPITAKFNVYVTVAQAFYVNIQPALERFFIAPEECVPGGPKFDMSFLRSIGTMALTLAQLFAVYAFQVFMQNWNFRTCFWVTTLIRMISSLSDVVVLYRWNTLIGIPDEVMYLLGYSVFSEMAYMLDFLPTIVLIAKLSPKKLEATMFSLLGGNFNFGYTVAYLIGVFLYSQFTIVSSIDLESGVTECDFSQLIYIIIIAHIILPAITIALVFFLIPNNKLFDTLIPDQYYIDRHNRRHNKTIIDNKNELVV